MILLGFIIRLAVLLSLLGCTQPLNGLHQNMGRRMDAKILHVGSQCGVQSPRPEVVWIDSAKKLDRLYQQLTSHRINSVKLPLPDFTREGILFIAMGQKPTAGFQLDLKAESILIRDDTLEVTVYWREPPSGYMVAQVITSPCMLLQLPMAPFEAIRILDQQGQVRISAQRG